ncbi:colicin immunity domain-containing protein [Kitasatospora sp. NPDC056783]|uniref:colicin immunity domain-containing protein n=1 Tax=Kitasatospora sp. NPDC056783 TaxID=3345943 RepID=UPI0036C533F2
MDSRVVPFVVVSKAFAEGRISASEFEVVFLALFRAIDANLDAGSARAVDTLFSAVDSYCPDPDIRDDFDVDEEMLRAASMDFLENVHGCNE